MRGEALGSRVALTSVCLDVVTEGCGLFHGVEHTWQEETTASQKDYLGLFV